VNYPRVGVGVIVVNADGHILIGKRTGSHAPKYSIPGGKLELGESFEATAIRELKEEFDITVKDPEVIAITNDLETYAEDGVHWVSIAMLARNYEGTPKIMEPDKCSEWGWYDPHRLPQPHFDASTYSVRCWLEHRPHIPQAP
jgi:8-oxo-dGTP diphosphatase